MPLMLSCMSDLLLIFTLPFLFPPFPFLSLFLPPYAIELDCFFRYTMGYLCILTLNVKGLNSTTIELWSCITSSPWKPIFVYKRHFSQYSFPKYISARYPQVFQAKAQVKKWGVLIAFWRSTQFLPSKEIKDPNGRYLVHTGFLHDREETICSLQCLQHYSAPLL